ncbi:MAG: hypothetical protein WAN34_04965 [Acidimicrobiia bacterium]
MDTEPTLCGPSRDRSWKRNATGKALVGVPEQEKGEILAAFAAHNGEVTWGASQ